MSRGHRRDAETERLRSALAAAGGGAGGGVFLTGEAGIGKPRLASELAAEARARGMNVLAGRAVPTRSSIPYRPLTEVCCRRCATVRCRKARA